eukprot:TRINITY_DN65261_c0_g1_i1.p1 TRINITY_DN65261_c0_g1~~TRINITY_DN65261_c0_g1_i1.p1  ORF type:complete len:271 (+),score=88.19 TRINITY_DN65261_c0_g1_i1:78-815(+)
MSPRVAAAAAADRAAATGECDERGYYRAHAAEWMEELRRRRALRGKKDAFLCVSPAARGLSRTAWRRAAELGAAADDPLCEWGREVLREQRRELQRQREMEEWREDRRERRRRILEVAQAISSPTVAPAARPGPEASAVRAAWHGSRVPVEHQTAQGRQELEADRRARAEQIAERDVGIAQRAMLEVTTSVWDTSSVQGEEWRQRRLLAGAEMRDWAELRRRHAELVRTRSEWFAVRKTGRRRLL